MLIPLALSYLANKQRERETERPRAETDNCELIYIVPCTVTHKCRFPPGSGEYESLGTYVICA